MRKITSLLLMGVVLFTGLPVPTFAEALDEGPESIVSDDTEILFSIDPSQIKNPIKENYDKFISESFATSIFSHFDESGAETLAVNYLVENLSTIKFSVAVWVKTEETALLMKIPEADYNKNFKTPYFDLEGSKEVESIKIYIPESGNLSGSAFAYINGYLITGEEDTVTAIATNYKKNPLSESANFKKTKAELSANSAISIIVNNIPSLLESMNNEEVDSTILSAYLTAGLSIEQTTNSLKFKGYAIQDPEKVKKLGFDYTTNDALSLYKYMPNENPIYFMNNSVGKNLISVIKAIEGYKETVDTIKKESSININTLLSILDKEIALSVNDNGKIYPAVTFLADIEGNAISIKSEIKKVLDFVWEKLGEEASNKSASKITIESGASNVTITKFTKKIDESNMDKYEIKFSKRESKNPYAMQIPESLSTVSITIGTTSDNILLISTDDNIASKYKEGLQNNAKIKALMSDKINAIGYVDISLINSYLQNIISIVQNDSKTNALNTYDINKFLNNLLGAWGTITTSTESTNSYMSVNSEIEIDLTKLISGITEIANDVESAPSLNLFNALNNSQKEFEDVEPTDWYGDNVYYLSTQGIINGYEDGTFKPNQNINRAEFVKLIITTLNNRGIRSYQNYDESNYEKCVNFTDVGHTEWYQQYVYDACISGIVSGYDDKTFRPNNPITRSEVAQILANIIKNHNLASKGTESQDKKFKDVKDEEWYAEAVKTVNSFGLMQGTPEEKFEPSRAINRAESAKVIKNLLDSLSE